jgi:hypothetical protein
VSTRRQSSLNLNAIPLSLWSILWPNSHAAVQNMRSNAQWFTNFTQAFAKETDLTLIPDEQYSLGTDSNFIISVDNQLASLRYKISIGRGARPPFKRYRLNK